MAFPLPVNVTGIQGWFLYANTVTDGLFGPLMLFLVGGSFFLTFLTHDDTKRAFIGAGLINLLLTIVFFFAGLVNGWYLIVALALAFGGILYLIANNEFVA